MASILKARSVVVVPRQINIDIQERVDSGEADRKPNFPETQAREPELSLVEDDREFDNIHKVTESFGEVSELDNLSYFDPNEAYDAKINQALEDAKAIRNEAEKEAQAILQSVLEEKEELFAEAEAKGYDSGYAKGIEEGKAAARNEAQQTLDELAYFIEMLKMERMQTIGEEEKSLLALSFEIARKVMRQQVKINKDTIPAMIADIVKEQESPVRVILSEYQSTLDCHIDTDLKEKIKKLLPEIKVHVIPNDDAAELIQIETAEGMIDAGIGGQLMRLQEATADPKPDYDD